MLTALFLLALVVLAASFFRPPTALWQRAIMWLAVILLLAVLVAWSLDYIVG